MKKRFLVCLLVMAAISCSKPQPPSIPTPISTPTIGSIVQETDPITNFGRLAPPDLNLRLPEKTDKNITLKASISASAYPCGRYFNLEILDDNTIISACVRGVDVFDIHTRGQLERLKTFDTPGHAWFVRKFEKHLWIADDYAGITILNPMTGEIEASWKQLENARAIFPVNDHMAVICRHADGATLISTTIAENPDIISSLPVTGKVFSAYSEAEMIYIGTMNGGYQAVSIQDPKNPVLSWTYHGPERILWCSKKNNLHYIADQDYGVWILEEKETGQPALVGRIELSGQIRDGCWYNETLILLARREGISVIDVKDPANPTLLDTVKPANEGRGVMCSGERIFFSDGDVGIKEFQLTPKRTFALSAQFSNNRLVTDTEISGEFVYSTQTRSGIAVSRLTQQGGIEHINQISGFDYAVNLDIQDKMLAVTDYDGLKLLDLTDPKNPKIISSLHTPGRATGVDLAGTTALVADWFEGVHFIDISDPQRPVIMASIKTDGWVIDVASSEHYAYVCAMNYGLITIDFKDKYKPVQTSVDASVGAPEGIAFAKNTLYISDLNSGLVMFKLDTPSKPEPVAYYGVKLCKGVQVRGDILVISNYFLGVKLFDVKDSENPVLIGELDTPGKAYETVFINDREAIVADWHDLLRISWDTAD